LENKVEVKYKTGKLDCTVHLTNGDSFNFTFSETVNAPFAIERGDLRPYEEPVTREVWNHTEEVTSNRIISHWVLVDLDGRANAMFFGEADIVDFVTEAWPDAVLLTDNELLFA
jgi:hypothetical protein